MAIMDDDVLIAQVKAANAREAHLRSEVRRLESEGAELTRLITTTKLKLARSEHERRALTRQVEDMRAGFAEVEQLRLERDALTRQVADLTVKIVECQRAAERAEDGQRGMAQQLAAMTLLAMETRRNATTRGEASSRA